ncbi:MAG: hypothetical protein GC162_04620 [Planctomycetes bacterium]|nr:hypothetical protein [Planctomycetota bacterium]
MSIAVVSPFTGHEVKVRPQDVGKAMKDDMGNMFYVLPRPDGEGYYTAPTKAGGQRDIDKYDAMLAKMNKAKETGAAGSAVQIAAAQRGGSAKSSGGMVKLIIAAAVIGALAWAVLFGPLKGLLGGGH